MLDFKDYPCISQDPNRKKMEYLNNDNHKGTNNKDVGGCKRTLRQRSQGKWAHSSSPVTIPGWNCQRWREWLQDQSRPSTSGFDSFSAGHRQSVGTSQERTG